MGSGGISRGNPETDRSAGNDRLPSQSEMRGFIIQGSTGSEALPVEEVRLGESGNMCFRYTGDTHRSIPFTGLLFVGADADFTSWKKKGGSKWSLFRRAPSGRRWNFPGISRVFPSLLFALVVVFLCGSFLANSSLTISHVAGPDTLLRLLLSFNSPLEVSDEDQALFKKAIAVANDPTSLAVGTRKIAFLYLTRGPLPLAPLWSRFFRGHEGRYSVYIHANPDYAYAPNELPFPFQGREIPNGAVQWGGRLMVAAERRLLAQGLLDRSNWYFVLLSESCIPLFPFDTVAAYITRSPYSFITTVVAPSLWRVDMLPDVPLGRWRKGDQWKEVHRSLAVEVVSDTRLFRRFTLHCHCSGCSWHKVGLMDEHYIPTLLHTIAGSRLANRSLTFVDWKNHEDYVHPHRFNATEVSEGLLRELRGITIFRPFSSEEDPALDCSTKGESRPCFMFARKFAPDTLQPLLKLSAEALGY